MALVPYICCSCDHEQDVELTGPLHKRPHVILCEECGERARYHFERQRGIKYSKPGKWPMTSCAVGVGEEQREEAMAHARRIGIPTEFNKDGDAVFTSRGHRRKYCEAIGFFDRSGGYGDPQTADRHGEKRKDVEIAV